MSDERRDQAMEAKSEERQQGELEDDDDDEVDSPFDHPAFLPVILWGLSVWFGYDGWFNDAEHLQDDLAFNRYGFGLLVIAAIYFTVQAVRETRQASESDDS